MILSNGRSAANHSQRQEKQAGYFQPEDMRHASDAAQRDRACAVEGTHPTVLATLASRDAEKSPALGTETAG